MNLTSKPLASLIVVILIGGIFFSSAMGLWNTESTKQASVYTQGDYAGQANPADIRGSYTFGDVENNFGIPANLLAQAFGITNSNPAEYTVKSLESLYLNSSQEVGTASVRLFVAFYLNLPFELSTDIYLPTQAAALLSEHGLTNEQAAYLAAHTISATQELTATPESQNTTKNNSAPPLASPTVAEHDTSSDTSIKGKTTFADLLAWDVPAATIEKALGMPMPAAAGIKIKDFCAQNGLNFETIKATLQTEIDKMK